jgi:hypothetical protein
MEYFRVPPLSLAPSSYLSPHSYPLPLPILSVHRILYLPGGATKEADAATGERHWLASKAVMEYVPAANEVMLGVLYVVPFTWKNVLSCGQVPNSFRYLFANVKIVVACLVKNRHLVSHNYRI